MGDETERMKVTGIKITDWVMTDFNDIAQEIVRTSGKQKQPVALVFENPDDFQEYRGPDVFAPVVIDGQTYLRMPSRYSDAAFLEAKLAERGYSPVSVIVNPEKNPDMFLG